MLASNRVGDDGNGVAHNGGTAAYDFVGEALAQGEDNKPGVVITKLNKDKIEQFRSSFPAHLDADDFSINF